MTRDVNKHKSGSCVPSSGEQRAHVPGCGKRTEVMRAGKIVGRRRVVIEIHLHKSRVESNVIIIMDIL